MSEECLVPCNSPAPGDYVHGVFQHLKLTKLFHLWSVLRNAGSWPKAVGETAIRMGGECWYRYRHRGRGSLSAMPLIEENLWQCGPIHSQTTDFVSPTYMYSILLVYCMNTYPNKRTSAVDTACEKGTTNRITTLTALRITDIVNTGRSFKQYSVLPPLGIQ